MGTIRFNINYKIRKFFPASFLFLTFFIMILSGCPTAFTSQNESSAYSDGNTDLRILRASADGTAIIPIPAEKSIQFFTMNTGAENVSGSDLPIVTKATWSDGTSLFPSANMRSVFFPDNNFSFKENRIKKCGTLEKDAHLLVSKNMQGVNVLNIRSAGDNSLKEKQDAWTDGSKGGSASEERFWISLSNEWEYSGESYVPDMMASEGNEIDYLVEYKLVSQGKRCNVWSIADFYDVGELDDNQKEKGFINADLAKEITEKFDNIIYENVRILAGEEITALNDETPVGRRVNILFYPDASRSKSYGFFYGRDFYPKSGKQHSNEGKFLYINSVLWQSENEIPFEGYLTLSHEFMHMCNASVKGDNHFSSPSWVKEMFGSVCEDFLQVALGRYIDSEGVKNRLDEFCQSYYENTITDTSSYANLYTFGAFLFRNFGDVKLFQKISQDKEKYLDVLEGYVKECSGKSYSLEDLFLLFVQSLMNKTASDSKDEKEYHLNKSGGTKEGDKLYLSPIDIFNYEWGDGNGETGLVLFDMRAVLKTPLLPNGFVLYDVVAPRSAPDILTISFQNLENAAVYYFMK